MSGTLTTPPTHRARSVRRRLTAYSLVSAALMLIISAVSLTGINHQRQQTERLNAVINPVDDVNQQLMQNLLGAQSGLRAYGLIAPRQPGTEAELYHQAFDDRVSASRDRLAALDGLLGVPELTDDSGLRTRLLTLQGRQRVAVDAWLDFTDAYLGQQERTELQVLGGQRLFVAVTNANTELQRAVDAERVALQASIREGASRTSEAVIVATVGVLLLVLMAAWRTTVALTTPLLRLRDTVRRQRLGDRDAWARTDVGAAEVRDLAGDVNALTHAHLRLVDQQASSLALQRAGAIIGRRTQDAPDPRTALLVYAVGVGRALGADQVVCATLDRQGNFSNGVLWEPTGPRAGADVPPRWRSEILRFAAWMWRAEREIVVEDLRDGVPDLPAGLPDVVGLLEPASTARGGLLLVPIGNGDRAMGVIAVRTERLPRAWTDIEVSFARQSAAEVARVIVKAEVDHDRAEYVRQLEELDRRKDDFLSTVSHELRTPLTSIHGYLEMLEDGDAGQLTPRQLDMLAVVDRNATRLKTLIEDLLVLNRMQTSPGPAGSGDLLGVADLVRQTVEELRPLADQAKVAVSVEGDEESRIIGDRSQLSRALINVLSNAIKFTEAHGSVRIAHERVGEYVSVACIDTGIGIPEDEQDGLFVRFYRASNATAAQIQGTGLGLAIVKNIVERHGGHIELSSHVGVGTTVRLLIPSANYSTHDGRLDGRPGFPGEAA